MIYDQSWHLKSYLFRKCFRFDRRLKSHLPCNPDGRLATIRPYPNNDLGIVRIINTVDLETIVVSEAYLGELPCLDSIDSVEAPRSPDSGARGVMTEIS